MSLAVLIVVAAAAFAATHLYRTAEMKAAVITQDMAISLEQTN